MKTRRLALVVLLSLCLTACRAEIYQNLPESTANEVLSALLERGVAAEKISQGKSGFAVTVDTEEQLRALEILRDLGLPKPVYEGLGVVFRKEGMMSSPMEEKARFSYALSQELAASCSRLDGVVNARVHVVLREKDVLTGAVTPASAAVMLRHTPDAPVDRYIPQIRSLVVQAVPDVDSERVSVLTFPIMGDVTRPMSSGEKKPSVPLLWLFLSLPAGFLAGGLCVFLVLRFRKSGFASPK
ncbi:MAG: type III secretion inner membrane ring lipoprotein SctJ [Deltaproteobacteria bacterium]|jgi:type III secretion protein J|nr:type III secretion inner membrane ring lipoprotein SctJ [Deltaproteobacteria bacterium]